MQCVWRICTRALAAAQPDNLFSICFRVTCCHKVTHFSTDLPQLSTYVIYYLNKVLRCEGRVVRSVNFLLTDTVVYPIKKATLRQLKCEESNTSHLYKGIFSEIFAVDESKILKCYNH